MSAILVSEGPVVGTANVRGVGSGGRGARRPAGERHLRLVPQPSAEVPAVIQPVVPPTRVVPPAPVPALRLTRRGRLVVAVLSLGLVAGAGLLGSRAAADGPASAPVVERHVVASGETLWGIAASVARPGQDVRDVVEELKSLNGLNGAGLSAGQEIVVPAAG